MTTVDLSTLLTPTTPTDVYQDELTIAAGLSLPVTSWSAVQWVPAILNVNATIAAQAYNNQILICQGGFATLAALMVDTNGAPIVTWMRARALDQYGVTFFGATFASGLVPVSNAGPSNQSYSPTNPWHFQNPVTKATYTSTGSGTINASTSANVPIQADVSGSASTSGSGVTLTLLTPLAGLSVSPLAGPVVGQDAELNSALLQRCQNKLGTISVSLATDSTQETVNSAGPTQAYSYVATSIPQGTPSSSPPYAVSAPITRVSPQLDTSSGVLNVYIANANGSPSGTDVAIVNAAIQALVTPDAQINVSAVNVVGATVVNIALVATVYVKQSSGLTTAIVQTNIDDALATYAEGIPIGGVSGASSGIVPLSEIVNVLLGANPGTTDAIIASPTTSPSLGGSGIPAFPTPTLTVVFV